MTDREADEGIQADWFAFRISLGDIPIHLALNRRKESIDLVRFSLSQDLDAPIGKVTDLAGDLEASGQRLACEAETYALNMA